MKMKKINISAVVAAVGAGASYRFALEGAGNRVDFVNQNYLVVKSLAAGIIGSGLTYFGKSENSKAAGYALLGISGDAAASKLSTALVTTDDSKALQGISKLQRVRGMIGRKKAGASLPGRKIGDLQRMRQQNIQQTAISRPNMATPNCAVDYSGMAYADTLFSNF